MILLGDVHRRIHVYCHALKQTCLNSGTFLRFLSSPETWTQRLCWRYVSLVRWLISLTAPYFPPLTAHYRRASSCDLMFISQRKKMYTSSHIPVSLCILCVCTRTCYIVRPISFFNQHSGVIFALWAHFGQIPRKKTSFWGSRLRFEFRFELCFG